MAVEKQWDVSKVYLWINFCCLEKTSEATWQERELMAILGYIAVSDLLLIPSPKVPTEDVGTLNRLWGADAEAWWLMETLSFYAVKSMTNDDMPEMWVVAKKEAGQGLYMEQ